MDAGAAIFVTDYDVIRRGPVATSALPAERRALDDDHHRRQPTRLRVRVPAGPELDETRLTG